MISFYRQWVRAVLGFLNFLIKSLPLTLHLCFLTWLPKETSFLQFQCLNLL